MANVILTGYAEPDGNQFTAICAELGVATCADTAYEALHNLGEAIDVYLEGLAEVGTLERVLQERGVELHKDAPAPDRVSVVIPTETPVRAYCRTVAIPVVA